LRPLTKRREPFDPLLPGVAGSLLAVVGCFAFGFAFVASASFVVRSILSYTT